MLTDSDAPQLKPASRAEAIRRLEALHRFIQKIPASLINLDVSNDCLETAKEIQCGSVGCIAGWGIGMREFRRVAHIKIEDGDTASWFDLRVYLGRPKAILINGEWIGLFDSGDAYNGHDKKAALARIRAFIAHYRRARWNRSERLFARS